MMAAGLPGSRMHGFGTIYGVGGLSPMQMPAFLARFTMKEQVIERDAATQAMAQEEESKHSHPFPSLGSRLVTSAQGNHFQKPASL
jgi:hypothetical protein